MTEYWAERFDELEEDKNHDAELFLAALLVLFQGSIKSIKQHISSWFGKYGKVSVSDSRKSLSPEERKDFQKVLVGYLRDDVDATWVNKLEKMATKTRISRLEFLETEIRHEIEKVYGRYLKDIDEFAINLFVDQHDRVLFELAKGFDRYVNFEKADLDKVRRMMKTPWAVDGKVYSDRIWTDKTKLINEIDNTIARGLIRGDSCDTMTNEIVKRLNVSYVNADRLVKTESAFLASEAEREAYKKFGVDRYVYRAVIDNRTSEMCRYMNGHIFKVSDMKIGVNAPPLHCRCRSTTYPYFEEEESGLIDTTLTFEQWRQMFLK